MEEVAARRRLPLPDEAAAREHWLRHNIEAPDRESVMDFLRFYIATSRPQLDAKYPTQNSITTVAEWFFAGFTRITGTEIFIEEREAVYSVSTLKPHYNQ
jgi:hypothetical protein